MSAKQTAFTSIHERLGGKMVEFAGFVMPVQYSGIVEEHHRVRESVGIFDVSHMGEVEIRGKDALAFLQTITVNDVARLSEGRVQYSAMCMKDGGIVDDLLVYHLGDRYMLVINASNTAKDIAWMRENLEGDVELTDRTDATSLLAVQGPRALDTLQKLTRVNLQSVPYYHFTRGVLADVEMIISRTGYTGERGFELYFPSDRATGAKVWEAVMAAGKDVGILPIGLGARDTLRLEMGFCLYGNDIDATTHPLEAGLGWITKLEKPAFNGKDVLVKAKQEGLRRKLVGFAMEDKAFPRHGYAIQAAGAASGTVTSGTFSPILEKGIGMGYVETAHAKPGTRIEIVIRNRAVPAQVTPLPFIKNSAT
jgi:aminomethyltransferase